MNYDISKDTVFIRGIIYDGCQEQPLDLDFSLPDYCPDIQKILKCKVDSSILSRSISGDRLNIEGITNIRLIYLDSEKMSVHVCENSTPFSCSINLRTSPQNAFAMTWARLEYVNCRAVSPRKVDVHGAFSICAKVFGKEVKNIPCSISGKDIHQKIVNVNAQNLIGIGQQQFSVNEDLELTKEVQKLIRSEVNVSIDSYKIMQNKVVIKGETIIKLLFVSDLETGIPETMEYSVPISQIVDVPGVDENCRCVTMPEVLNYNYEFKPSSEESEEGNNVLAIDIKIVATVLAYEPKEIGIVSDVYSTDYDVNSENETFNLQNFETDLKDSFSHKATVDLEDLTASKIIDIWSDVTSTKSEFKDGKLNLNSKMNLCILALDSENIPFYIERATEVQKQLPFESDSKNVFADLFLTPVDIGHNISKGNSIIDVKINLKLYAAIYSEEKNNLITAVSADETLVPQGKDSDASLTIYYAEKGEPLWDIARKYYTSVNLVQQENNLEGDVVEKSGMILIPAVRH